MLQQIRFRAAEQFDVHLAAMRFESPLHVFPGRGLGGIVAVCGETLIKQPDVVMAHREFIGAFDAKFYCEMAQQFFLFCRCEIFNRRFDFSQCAH
jgi:hypothetical protein